MTDLGRPALGTALAGLPPPAGEAAVATLTAGVALALSNAVEVALTKSAAAPGLRAARALYDAFCVCAAFAWLALPFALAAAFGAGRVRARWGWLGFALASTIAMAALLQRQLDRNAHALLDGFAWWLIWALTTLSLALCVPAAYWLGALGARLRHGRAPALLLGVVGLAIGHVELPDDARAIHTVILWIASLLVGACIAPSIRTTLTRTRRRVAALAATCALLALGSLAVAPSNAVRLELFRYHGAVAPWLFARLLWSLPPIAERAPAPEVRALPARALADALQGIAEQPVVVLLTVDALRADALESKPGAPPLPNLRRLMRTGAYFTNARAAGTQTAVSLTSLFTSRYYSQLRWEYRGEGTNRFLYPVADRSLYFPELLSRAGVATESVLPVVFLAESFGIARGFRRETMTVDDRSHASATEVVTPLLAALDAAGSGPAFFYAHLMEPHEPYDRGKLKRGPPHARYLSEVEVVDRVVGRVARRLEQRFRDRGYLILSSDHGEAFGEHGSRFHGRTLYDELLRVPLLLGAPGIPARTLDLPVSAVDVGPSILHLFRVPVPAASMGVPLLPLVRGELGDQPRPIVAEGRLRRVLLSADGLKIIEDNVQKTVEAYDLFRDPGELVNLFDDDRARAHAALARLRAFFAEKTLLREGYEPPFKP